MKECYVTIQIPYNTESLEELFKAEKHLRNAGVHFDTGALVQERIRDWSFDWSLKGAKVLLHEKQPKDTPQKKSEVTN